ncbi:hypothetical protein T10_13627 [Trichinella papuae]|uniref:Uncharacterized protein n=1 Tax=Trichinella papuae TaxID=268474 RepID=A0A0V1LZT0_9BILA|nr:hypothetical protein T10_13627 [Trichinella papuae]
MNEYFNILCGLLQFPITPLTPFYPLQRPSTVLHQQLVKRFRRPAAALLRRLRIIFVRILSPRENLCTCFCHISNSISKLICLICCSALSETVDMQSSPKTMYGLCSIQDYLSKKTTPLSLLFHFVHGSAILQNICATADPHCALW